MAKRRKKPSYDSSHLEETFMIEWMRRFPLHKPVREHQFVSTRLWRFDFCWPSHKIAVEVQGYGPGHFSLKGATSDYYKLMAALRLNWKVLYLTSTMLSPENIDVVCHEVAFHLSIPPRPTTGYIPTNKR
jgi:hypothetical protein